MKQLLFLLCLLVSFSTQADEWKNTIILHYDSLISASDYNGLLELRKAIGPVLSRNENNFQKFRTDSLLTSRSLLSPLAQIAQSSNLRKLRRIEDSDSLLREALTEFNTLNFRAGEAFCYRTMGLRKYAQKKYDEALPKYNQALNICYELGDSCNCSYVHYLKANLFSKLQDFEKSKNELLIASQISKKAGGFPHDVRLYNNLASVLFELNEDSLAVRIWQNLLDQYPLPKIEKARIMNNIGLYYYANSSLGEAKKYILKCLLLQQELSDTSGLQISFNNLAQIELNQHNYAKALSYLRKSHSFINSNANPKSSLTDLNYNYTRTFIQLSEKDSALSYLEKFALTKKELYNKDITNRISELEVRYETQKKEQELQLAKTQNESKETIIRYQKISLSILGILILGLTLMGITLWRQRKRIEQANLEIIVKQEEVGQVNDALKTSIKARERILSIIGHDLRGPIGGLKDLVNLYLELDDLTIEEYQEMLGATQETLNSSYNLLENLLGWANIQRGNITCQLAPLNVNEDLPYLVDLIDKTYNRGKVIIKTIIEPNLFILADENMFHVILRNIIGNAIKFSPEGALLTIEASERENGIVQFSVTDQGKGIPPEQLALLFNKGEEFFIPDKQNSTKGSGLGLLLCKEFTEKMKGKIWAKSTTGIGSTFYFTIPSVNSREHDNSSLAADGAICFPRHKQTS